MQIIWLTARKRKQQKYENLVHFKKENLQIHLQYNNIIQIQNTNAIYMLLENNIIDIYTLSIYVYVYIYIYILALDIRNEW